MNNQGYQTITFRKLSRHNGVKWIHLPYKSDLSVTVNNPDLKRKLRVNTLLIKINYKGVDLERLVSRSNNEIKGYKRYPLIALRYMPKQGDKRKVQLAFDNMMDFMEFDLCLGAWGIHLQEVEDDAFSCSQIPCSQITLQSDLQIPSSQIQCSQVASSQIQCSQLQCSQLYSQMPLSQVVTDSTSIIEELDLMTNDDINERMITLLRNKEFIRTVGVT